MTALKKREVKGKSGDGFIEHFENEIMMRNCEMNSPFQLPAVIERYQRMGGRHGQHNVAIS